MEFQTQTTVECSKEELWSLLFDVTRVAELIPGCSDVEEIKHLEQYSAVIRQKVGPFKFEMPCEIVVDEYIEQERVAITANGQDKKTATSVMVKMVLTLGDAEESGSVLMDIDSDIQIAGKLATLGFPVVNKKCKDIFREFDTNLQKELEGVHETKEV